MVLPNPKEMETAKKLKKLKTEMSLEETHFKIDAQVDEPTDETDTEWSCNYCSKRFQKKKFLKSHHNKKHPEKSLSLKKLFQCQDCPREFTSKKPFAKHRDKHLNEKVGNDVKVQVISSHKKSTVENGAAIEKNLQFLKTPQSTVETEIDSTDIEEVAGGFEDAAELTEDVQKALENTGIDEGFHPEPLNMDVSDYPAYEEEQNIVLVDSESIQNIPESRAEEISLDINQTLAEENVSTVEDESQYREEWICGLCTKRFSGEKFVNTHMEKKHAGEAGKIKKVFACCVDDYCEKSFAILKNMKNHLSVHSSEVSVSVLE